MKRKLFLLFFAYVAGHGQLYAGVETGTCGDNLTWTLNSRDSTLTIEGSGDMYYEGELPPWFEYQSYIAYVSFPEGLTSIAKHAFFGCYSLRSIVIPQNVTSIGGDAFLNCLSLDTVTIHSNEIVSTTGHVKQMSGYFGYNVRYYIIGEPITEIGEFAFYCCSALVSVSLPEGLKGIKSYAFKGCTKLLSINIPNTTEFIGSYAFYECGSLESITIPDNVTDIGGCVFYSCTRMTTACVGRNVPSLGNLLVNCPRITHLTIRASTPPGPGMSSCIDQSKCTLYVHQEDIETYRNAIWWEDFVTIKAIEEDTSVDTIETNSSLTNKRISHGQILIECGDKTYTLQGQKVR